MDIVIAVRKFAADAEQIQVLQLAMESFDESQKRHTKDTFIREFLAFSNRVTSDGGGSRTEIGKGLAIFQNHGTSNHIAAPTEDAPERGFELEVYRAVVGKEDYWTKGKPIGGVAVSSEVQSGLIVAGTFPRLAGQVAVMRVTSIPPEVRYVQDDGELMPIEPATDAWDEMTVLAESLTSREAELRSRFQK